MTLDFIPPAKPIVGDEEREAVDRVLRSGMLAQGPEVAAFETEFSEHFKLGRACVAVNSGTSGLHLGLLSSGIGAGDFTLDPASVEASITERTKAIMPVHLYGHPAKMAELQAIADKHGLMLFEDAAQAHGAALHGTPVGAFGEFAMFSLYPTKNMTSGEGGMVSAANDEVERNLRLYRNQGMLQQYHNEVVGLNNRMTDIHAAIGRVQLTKVGAWTAKRQENAAFLSANLEGVTTPPVADGAVHVYHQYTVRVAEDRDGLAKALKDEYNVGSGMFYPVPNHRLKPFQVDVELANTEQAALECLSLPVHPSLSQNDLERIVAAVNALAKAGA